jgi:hypothetical protein
MDGERASRIDASPLSRDHDYIRAHTAPAYWALAPHLIHQHTDASCSLATATMLLNGIRALDGTAQDYEPCWVDLKRLLRAMTPISPVSGTPRGYCVLKRG